MGILYLVRHGQASLGADDYDQLSPLGLRQSVRLGQYFAEQGLGFEAVLMGGLRRHAQTWSGIAEGMADTHPPQLAPTVWSALNEYDSEAVIASADPGPHARPTTPESYRQHFRLLRQGLAQWASGTHTPATMRPYAEFARGITEVLDHVRSQHSGNVLLVSSGGPIATAVAQLLGASAQGFVELNMRLRNTAVSELVFSTRHHALQTFNGLAHLDGPQYASWVSFA